MASCGPIANRPRRAKLACAGKRKILNRRTRKVGNLAAVAFRDAASTLLRSDSYLGAQYRR